MSTKTEGIFIKNLAFWGFVLALIALFLWAFNSILLPFILGVSIAYLLNPVVTKLNKYKIPRWAGAVIILGSFVVIMAGLCLIFAPIIYKEIQGLIEVTPGYIDKIWAWLTPYIEKAHGLLGEEDLSNLKEGLKDNATNALQLSGGFLSSVASGGQAIIGFVTTLIVAPIVSFFLMKDWDAMSNWVYGLLPRKNEKTIRNLLSQIDQKIAGFVRGQLSIAFALGIIYALALVIAGLDFGLLIGFSAGILSIIPLFGSTIGLIVSLAVAWFQAGTYTYMGIIAAIFLVGQFIEGNILSPKILGDSVGLHPLWILFAVMAGGSLMGITGMLIAVPMIASAGVLINFGIEWYKNSSYYGKEIARKTKKTKAKKAATK